MATIGELNVLLKLTGVTKFKDQLKEAGKAAGLPEAEDGKKRVEELDKSLKEFRKGLNALTRDLGILGREFRSLGLAITGTFAVAFATASKELPKVDRGLTDLKRSVLEVNKSLAVAALPSLKDLSDTMTGFSNLLKRIDPQLINQVFRFGAFALAVGTLTLAFRSMINVIKTIPFILNPTNLLFLALSSVAVFAILKIIDHFKLFEGQLERTVDVFGRFARGVKNQFNDLATNAEIFGRSVAQSLETAFGDTLFNAITGRLKGLRNILKSFGEDILRASTKGFANFILGSIFGNAQGGKGLFSSLSKFFGFGTSDLGDETDKLADKFRGLSFNLDLFARAKDRLIEGFNQAAGNFTRGGLQGGSQAGITGLAASGIGATIPSIPQEALGTLGIFASLWSGVKKSVDGTVLGIGNVAKEMIKMFATTVIGFTITSATLVAIAAATGAIVSGIVTAYAAQLAAAWAPAALFASIATFGGAAVVGTGALLAASAALGGIVSLAGATSRSGSSGFGTPGGRTPIIENAEPPKLQEGGIVRKPTLAMVGEAGPEAIVPLSKGGAGLGGGVTVQFNEVAFFEDDSALDKFVRKLSDALVRTSNRRIGGTVISL